MLVLVERLSVPVELVKVKAFVVLVSVQSAELFVNEPLNVPVRLTPE